MREIDLTDDEFVEFSTLHASVCTPGYHRLNPYHVGLKIFEDIEKRLGRDQIFAVRELESDASFIRSYLTEELVRDLDLYIYRLEDEEFRVAEKAWEKVRDATADSLTSHGRPVITVEDGDWQGKRELYLKHHYDGRPLDLPYAEHTLIYLRRLWGRPVHLETTLDGDRGMRLTCVDGAVEKTLL